MVRKSIEQIRAEDRARRARFAAEEKRRQAEVAKARAERQRILSAEAVPRKSQARITETTFIPEIETVVMGGPSQQALQRARQRQGARGVQTVQRTASRRGRQTVTTTIRQKPVQQTRDLRISEIGRRFGSDAAIRELRFRFAEAETPARRAKLQRQADFFGFDLTGRALARPKAPAPRVIRVGATATPKTKRLARTGQVKIQFGAGSRTKARRRSQSGKKRRRRVRKRGRA